jgi:hypothetical protein
MLRRKSVKDFRSIFAILIGFTPALSGCEIAGDIFKAGVWVGVILVLGVIGIIVWLFTRSGS